jgi:hypothetical protein
MLPTEKNFEMIRSISLLKWNKLSVNQKRTYWKLHQGYPDEELLDHLEEEGINEEVIDEEYRIYCKETKRKYRRRSLQRRKKKIKLFLLFDHNSPPLKMKMLL